MTGFVSSCHSAELVVVAGNEGTAYYRCFECHEPCDPVAGGKLPSPVDGFDGNIMNENVRECAKKLASAIANQRGEAETKGSVHLVVLGSGSITLGVLIPKRYDVAKNYLRIKAEVDRWIDGELERLKKEAA